ncbi:DUF6259 domain-containing protein, partial [bacterium]|nr:DUF6259 domain-containing protein [bacterium]
NLAVDSAPVPLFSLSLGPEGPDAITLTSLEAKRSGVSVESVPEGRRATLTYGDFPVAGITVTVRVTVPAKGPLTTWSLSLHSDTPLEVRSVRFPQLAAPQAIGDSADDVLVVPTYPGALIRNPVAAWSANQSLSIRYPGEMSAQFVAFQDTSAGLYLASQDSGANLRRLTIQRQTTGFGLTQEYVASTGKVSNWETPYPCVVGVTQGTWHDTADLYKGWAVQQAWCSRTLDQRADIPDWWKAGPLVHVCEVRTYKDGVESGSYYPKLVEHVNTLRTKTDSPIVLMLAGWEHFRRWSAGDYFPIFDQEAARPVISQLRAEGVRPFVFLSGLFWTHLNEGNNGNTPPVPEEWKPSFVRDLKTGELQSFVLNESRPGGTWRRHSYQFCVSAPGTRTFLHQVVDRAHEEGIDVVQMDQTTSGGGAACGSPDHGHPVGPGVYQTRDFLSLLADMRAYGKSKSPDSVLFHEEPHEELIPVLDGFHVREYKERFWYRGTPGAVGIPLFDYLYHEYAIGYGGDSCPIATRKDPWNTRCHAVNLITGRTPGVSVWGSQSVVADCDPDPMTVIRQHTHLLQRGGEPFLMLGRMLHPLRLQVPEMTYQISVQGKDGWHREPFVEPSVLTSSWQAADGRIAHVFVNPTPEARALTVGLDTRNLPTWPAAEVQLYSSAEGEQFRQVAASSSLPFHLERQIAPLEVLCVVLKPVPAK